MSFKDKLKTAYSQKVTAPKGYQEIEEKVIKLIRKSNNRGGMDNISIAYLEFSESGDQRCLRKDN